MGASPPFPECGEASFCCPLLLSLTLLLSTATSRSRQLLNLYLHTDLSLVYKICISNFPQDFCACASHLYLGHIPTSCINFSRTPALPPSFPVLTNNSPQSLQNQKEQLKVGLHAQVIENSHPDSRVMLLTIYNSASRLLRWMNYTTSFLREGTVSPICFLESPILCLRKSHNCLEFSGPHFCGRQTLLALGRDLRLRR